MKSGRSSSTRASRSELRVRLPPHFNMACPGHEWHTLMSAARSDDHDDRLKATFEALERLESIASVQRVLERDPPPEFARVVATIEKLRKVEAPVVSNGQATDYVETLREAARRFDTSEWWNSRIPDWVHPSDVDWDAIALEARSYVATSRVGAVLAAQTCNEALLRELGYDKDKYKSIFRCIEVALTERGETPNSGLSAAVQTRNDLSYDCTHVEREDAVEVVAIHAETFSHLLDLEVVTRSTPVREYTPRLFPLPAVIERPQPRPTVEKPPPPPPPSIELDQDPPRTSDLPVAPFLGVAGLLGVLAVIAWANSGQDLVYSVDESSKAYLTQVTGSKMDAVFREAGKLEFPCNVCYFIVAAIWNALEFVVALARWPLGHIVASSLDNGSAPVIVGCVAASCVAMAVGFSLLNLARRTR